MFHAGATLLAAVLCVGCQSGSISVGKLAASQSQVKFDGLESTRMLPAVYASGATPRQWAKRPTENGAIYTHEQWRSPTGVTSVGVVYVHLPLPIGPAAILWLAEQHFAAMPGETGHVLAAWTDALGRSWFTAQNPKCSICGYIMTEGASAWIVYYGYKLDGGLQPAELSVAARSVTTIIPLTQGNDQPAASLLSQTPQD
jgi:hypothetical protein